MTASVHGRQKGNITSGEEIKDLGAWGSRGRGGLHTCEQSWEGKHMLAVTGEGGAQHQWMTSEKGREWLSLLAGVSVELGAPGWHRGARRAPSRLEAPVESHRAK